MANSAVVSGPSLAAPGLTAADPPRRARGAPARRSAQRRSLPDGRESEQVREDRSGQDDQSHLHGSGSGT